MKILPLPELPGFVGLLETGFLCIALAVLKLIVESGWPWTHLPAAGSHVLWLKVCITTPSPKKKLLHEVDQVLTILLPWCTEKC